MRHGKRIVARIRCSTYSQHIAQIYTGYGLLEKAGVLDVVWERVPNVSAKSYISPFLDVLLDNHLRLHYDMADICELDPEFELADYDFIFKRSYQPSYLSTIPGKEKIFPAGLSYFVTSSSDHELTRLWWTNNDAEKVKRFLSQSRPLSHLLGLSSSSDNEVHAFEALPTLESEPSILFIPRLWKPDRMEEADLREEREVINRTRVELVRRLRREFGSQFIGGLIHESYSIEHYPDCLLENKDMARKQTYLEMMRHTPICIATAGLQGSIGWKFAEYIAAARAIVTEENKNEFPFGLNDPENFLSFSSVDGCVEAIIYLIAHPEVYRQMMQRNFSYYHSFLRPDMLVLNSILVALSRA